MSDVDPVRLFAFCLILGGLILAGIYARENL